MSREEFSERAALGELRDRIVEVDGEPRVEVDVDGRRHTVELRQIFSFERDILDNLIEPKTDASVTGAAIPIKGEWIHGWLNVKGEDYINNIWKNYQFFLKFIEARTSAIENVGTVNRSPGTYDSMYRYLLILEELDLLERFRTEAVGEDEYDFPVPEEFRQRTFIRLQEDFESNKDKWQNPYQALYPGGEKVPSDDEDDDVSIDVEPEGEPEGGDVPEELTGFRPDQPQETEDTEEDDGGGVTGQGLGAFTGDSGDEVEQPEEVEEGFELPDNASFEDFPQKEGIKLLVENSFPEALERTFEEAPIPTSQAEPEDFASGQIAIFGAWAVGVATPGQSALELIVSVDDSAAELSPGFVPAGVQEHLGNVMKENNPYPDIFPNYFIVSSYNSAFQRTVDQVVRREQDRLVFYDLQDMELEEL